MVQTLESDIERYLVHMVNQCGGLCYKWVSPGNAGVPDRIVITIRGVYFIELKRSEKHHPRALQKYYLSQIKKQGANVLVIHSKTQVEDFIKEAF